MGPRRLADSGKKVTQQSHSRREWDLQRQNEKVEIIRETCLDMGCWLVVKEIGEREREKGRRKERKRERGEEKRKELLFFFFVTQTRKYAGPVEEELLGMNTLQH